MNTAIFTQIYAIHAIQDSEGNEDRTATTLGRRRDIVVARAPTRCLLPLTEPANNNGSTCLVGSQH